MFMDADMLIVSDITELVSELDEHKAVSVVRSVEKLSKLFMVFNCEHTANQS